MDREELIVKAIAQIVEDVSNEDYSAIQELLGSLNSEILKNYVGEEKQESFMILGHLNQPFWAEPPK